METLANSRKLNDVSLIKFLQPNEMTEKENRQFSTLVRSPTIDQALVERYHSDNEASVNNKSFKSIFKKLRGSVTTASNDNKSLLVSPTVPSSRALYSKYEPATVIVKPKKKKNSAKKDQHLPAIVTMEGGRKTLSDDSGVSANNTSSIYSTFHQDSQITTTSCSSTISSSSSSISSYESFHCMKRSTHTVQNLTDYTVIDEDDEVVQRKLWNEDGSICPKEEIAQWLGSKPESRSNILRLYMNNFNFKGLRLDDAFRALCSKLYIKGESQQLDRIIEAFAKRFCECNPNSLLHCVDVVHAVAYSLLLLNTDLHIVSDWGNKMTKTGFIKNTMETVQALVYPDVDFTQQRKRRASIVSRAEIDTVQDERSQWLADVECLLKDMYMAVKSHRIDQATSTPHDHAPLQRSRTLPKNTQTSTVGVVHRPSVRRRRGRSVIHPLDTLAIETAGPMPKQGLVMRKHVMESTDKRARHRQWQLCYLVIKDNELIMYRPTHQSDTHDQDGKLLTNKQRRRSLMMMLWNQSMYTLHDIVAQGNMEDWQADMSQPPLNILQMNHIYASAVPPPGWKGHRPHVFRLETAEGGLWLFESIDMFAIQAWVEAANTTASRISKGPLPGAVCNIDYGWGPKWDNATEEFTSDTIPMWYPPSPCMVNSSLDLNEQLKDIELQMSTLNAQLKEHRQLKLSLNKKFSATGNQHVLNSMQALTNWDRKLHHILHELIKLTCYKESLREMMRSHTV